MESPWEAVRREPVTLGVRLSLGDTEPSDPLLSEQDRRLFFRSGSPASSLNAWDRANKTQPPIRG